MGAHACRGGAQRLAGRGRRRGRRRGCRRSAGEARATLIERAHWSFGTHGGWTARLTRPSQSIEQNHGCVMTSLAPPLRLPIRSPTLTTRRLAMSLRASAEKALAGLSSGRAPIGLNGHPLRMFLKTTICEV